MSIPSIPIELVREIILLVGDPKTYGNLLRANSLFSRSLYPPDFAKQKIKFLQTLAKKRNKIIRTWTVLPKGEKEGTERRTMEDGTLISEINWVEGKKEGPNRKWIKKHVAEYRYIVKEGFWSGGKKTGLWKKWSHVNGTIRSKTEWFEGEKNGIEETYIDGVMCSKGNLKNGKRDGPWIYFFDLSKDGDPSLEMVYSMGSVISYWDNSELGESRALVPSKEEYCLGVTKAGSRCRNKPRFEFGGFCGLHRPSIFYY
jgi:hypothetical protein